MDKYRAAFASCGRRGYSSPFHIELLGAAWLVGMTSARALFVRVDDPRKLAEAEFDARIAPKELREAIERKLKGFMAGGESWRVEADELRRWVGADKLEGFDESRLEMNMDLGWIGEFRYDRNLFAPAVLCAPNGTLSLHQEETGELFLWGGDWMLLVMKVSTTEPSPVRLRVLNDAASDETRTWT